MYNIKNYEYDCSRKCHCVEHGNIITAALTKRSIPDKDLAAFIAKTCCNFCDNHDDLGRSAVHLAASVGRYTLLEWLINQKANINGADFESRSTPLHRAIYYGGIDCALLLLRYGANPDLLDRDTRSPLQNICRMSDISDDKNNISNELFVWGSNKNYNLGIDKAEDITIPQPLNYFRKEHISLRTLALGTYHSLFLDKKYTLYAVGHGEGGRLGTGNETTLTIPKRVKLPIKTEGEFVVCVSSSSKHSLLLTNHSIVYACGLNDDYQLGVRGIGKKSTVFKEVITLRDNNVEGLQRVIALDSHSLAYSEKYIYAWGANHGQLGMDDKEEKIQLPRKMKLPLNSSIEFVEANNSATVVYTKNIGILLYYKNKMKIMKSPHYEDLKSIAIVGGDIHKNAKGTPTALKLLALTKTNVIFIWYENTHCYYRCGFTGIRISVIDQLLYRGNQVLMLSNGDVYKSKCQQTPIANAEKRDTHTANIWSRCDNNPNDVSNEHFIGFDLQRLPNIDRVQNLFCDNDFTAFAALQESNWKYFKLPQLTPEQYTFKKLLNDASESDAIHDILFHVDGETFAAHKFIVYSRAPGLREQIKQYPESVHLNFPHLTGKMFELMLKFIYCNEFIDMDDLDDMRHSLGPDSPDSLIDVCQIFLGFVERFQLSNLAKFTKIFINYQLGFIYPEVLPPDKSQYRFNRLRRTDFPELYDVTIVCADGEQFSAHKCILVARLDYFEMMFSHTWAEQSHISLSTVPIEYLLPIVDFLYTSDVEHFRKQNYGISYLYNMIVYCDQFFVERLRKICEILLLDKITIRKCGEMLDFANVYNCEVMRRGCMDFICQNLARVLTYRSLEHCEPDSLKYLNSHYRMLFQNVFDYRMITPDSVAVEDEMLYSFIEDFQVDLNERLDEAEATQQKSATKYKPKEKENKTRQYEREAIHTMMEKMQLNEQSMPVKNEVASSRAVKEAQETAEKLQIESKNWSKVIDKKEQKKRLSLEHIAKINETLRNDEAPKSDFVPLVRSPESTFRTPEKESSQPQEATTPSTTPKAYNFSLAEFTPTREKLSQKQRKRLSSQSSTQTPAAAVNVLQEPTKPINVPAQPNAWGIVPQSPPIASIENFSFNSPPAGSAYDATSFANMMKSPSTSKSSPAANSFSQILAEERKQREYYERMRNKSLVLTQLEERAIAELREFYNVDNVTDEVITIERVQRPATRNFAVWQKH